MLKEHLTQEHDAASRRFPTIDRHVRWIHDELLHGQPGRILDLGCGPGLYTSRLARLGHSCAGIDFSPASIRYARQAAEREGLACTYLEEDLRRADFGFDAGPGTYALGMLIFGEFNVFPPAAAGVILQKSSLALCPGGLLLLEPNPAQTVQNMGQQGAAWYTSEGGLFSASPYLALQERFWDEAARAATHRYWIIDAASGDVTRYASSYQAYTHEEFRALLERAGFAQVRFYPSLGGAPGEPETDLIAITAVKPD